MPAKPIAVIILNWNGAGLFSEYLTSVIRHTPGDLADIIVADNGSADDSPAILARDFPQVKTLLFDTNLGFAAGYNRAITLTHYRYTVLLNSDVAVADDWLTPLYRFMTEHPDAGACQPKVLSHRRPGYFEYAGAAGGFLDCHGYPYCRGRVFDTVEPDNGQYDDTAEIDWASGACLMVDTDAYLNAGGLDPSFFAHMEEIDLCWRLRLAGHRIYAVGSASVRHFGGASLPMGDPRKIYLNFRNNLLMLHKNLPSGVRSRKLIIRRMLDTVAWAKMVLSLNLKGASAIWHAHRDYAKAKRALPVTQSQTDCLHNRPDIIINYYLRRRHTFSAILSRADSQK